MQVDLNISCRECDSLCEQIQLQRETAAASLNRLQKLNNEKCAELQKRIQDQAGKLNEVRGIELHVLDHEVISLFRLRQAIYVRFKA